MPGEGASDVPVDSFPSTAVGGRKCAAVRPESAGARRRRRLYDGGPTVYLCPVRSIGVLLLAPLALAAEARAQAPAAPAVTVETRSVPGQEVKQVLAQARLAAPPHVLRAVIADLERYPAFMPYVKESRVLGRDPAGEVLNYQRLSFGMLFVDDRHYVIRIVEHRGRESDGRLAYAFVWSLEPGLPGDVKPAAAIRVSVNRGFWDLRPARDGSAATDVRYCVLTDPAGNLPKWAVGLANSQAVPELFAAVAREAATPRYAGQAAPSAPETLPAIPPLHDCGAGG